MISSFLEDHDVKSNSRSRYSYELKIWFLWLSKNGIPHDQVQRSHVINYKHHLEKEHQITTIRNYLTSLSLFYRWAHMNGHYDDITLGIKLPKHEDNIKRLPLEPQQARMLLKSINTSTPSGLRDYTIINLMLRSGMRRVEIIRLDVGDLVYEINQHGLRIQRKGMLKKHFKPITGEMYDIIEKWLVSRQELKDEDPMFTSFSRNGYGSRLLPQSITAMIRRYFNQVGLGNKYSCHSLRHTTAITLLNEGKSLEYVKTYLGHKTIATTQLYTRYIENRMKLDNSGGQLLDKILKI